MAEGTAGPLNLGDADLKGIEAVDAGRYNCTIFAMTMDAVKNADGRGKMPAGTPMVKVQFRANENNPDGLENRRFFSQYILPPKDYDKEKAAKMKGMFARFLMALGEKEEDIRAKGYDPDFEDFVGRECVVVVGREQKMTREGGELVAVDGEYNNPVKGVKPAGSITTGGADSQLL